MASARTIGRLHAGEIIQSAPVQKERVKLSNFDNSQPNVFAQPRERESRIRARFCIAREEPEPQPAYSFDPGMAMSIMTESAPASGDRFEAMRTQERFAQLVRAGRFRAGGRGAGHWAAGPAIQM